MTISILKIQRSTTVDGTGMRTSIYGAGCAHFCPKCHNPQSWSFHNGTIYSVDEVFRQLCEESEDITFTGGDPFYQREAFANLAQLIKENTTKNIWCYTGYTFEKLLLNPQNLELLKHVDVLVDGPYVDSLRNTELLFRGSSNQRLIDVPKSLQLGETVLYAPDIDVFDKPKAD